MIGRLFIVGMQTDAKRLTGASLGLYIKAVVPSAGAGESRYKNKAIKKVCAYSVAIISWFCHGLSPFFSMTIFCYILSFSLTFCFVPIG